MKTLKEFEKNLKNCEEALDALKMFKTFEEFDILINNYMNYYFITYKRNERSKLTCCMISYNYAEMDHEVSIMKGNEAEELKKHSSTSEIGYDLESDEEKLIEKLAATTKAAQEKLPTYQQEFEKWAAAEKEMEERREAFRQFENMTDSCDFLGSNVYLVRSDAGGTMISYNTAIGFVTWGSDREMWINFDAINTRTTMRHLNQCLDALRIATSYAELKTMKTGDQVFTFNGDIIKLHILKNRY